MKINAHLGFKGIHNNEVSMKVKYSKVIIHYNHIRQGCDEALFSYF